MFVAFEQLQTLGFLCLYLNIYFFLAFCSSLNFYFLCRLLLINRVTEQHHTNLFVIVMKCSYSSISFI